MTHWHFNLRSGYESDDEEDLGAKQTEPAPSAEDELHDLFGTNEETVVHKPNPWNIAKMNANTRRTANKLYHSPDEGTDKRHSELKSGPNSSNTKPQHSVHLKYPYLPQVLTQPSLKDSISAALRRVPAIPTEDCDATHGDVSIPNNFTQETSYGAQETVRSNNRDNRKRISSPPSIPQITDHDHFTEQSEHNDQHYTSTEILSRNATTSPTKNLFALQVHNTGCETHEEHTPPLTWAHPSSDDFVSPIKSPRPLLGHHKRTEESWEHTSLFDVHSSSGGSLRIPLSPDPTHSTPTFTGWSLNNVYANMEIPRKLELQRIVGTLRDSSSTRIEIPRAKGEEDYLETSTLLNTPFSAQNALKLNSIHTSATQAKQDRNIPARPEKENNIPSLRYGLVTPPRQASRSLAKSDPWFDPDEEPVWSTLPACPKKAKQVKTPVITSRFRLPESFLGSSPLGEKQPKQLYKPPPRKRSREQNEALRETRWKGTRTT
ncbi:hypothetical protein RhiLY_12307 [Ceratobasidium sp. AG-Ba]|nr:hypothetical protein RhiLY_12307 [Ceratobasidium sp. AG-Ba]